MATGSLAPPALLDGVAERPTRARYVVLGFLCALSFVLYLDRVCISVAVDPIQRDLGISNSQMGCVLWAFTLAYGLFEVPTGRWGDRYGSRGVLTRIVLWWSAFTALTGAAAGFASLVMMRFLFGAGEAGAYPNAARVLARWFPAASRGSAQGWITTSAQIGAVLAQVVAGYLISWFGWRWSFLVFGLVGVVWAAMFYAWYRDDPAQHPATNRAERQLLSRGAGASASSDPHPPVPWRLVLTSPTVWLMGGIMNCAAFAYYMYISWYPKYLQAAHCVTITQAGWLGSMVLAGGAVGSTLGGYLSDWLVARTGNRRWSRRGLGCAAFVTASLAVVASIQCRSPIAVSLLTALACMSAQAQIASWWAVVTETSGKHLGALFGLMNSMGVFGAGGSQLFWGALTDWLGAQGRFGREQWDPPFYANAIILLLGAVCWLFVDATRSIVERPALEPQTDP